MINSFISDASFYVPETVMDNAFLETIVDTSDEWIVTRTGIKERRILLGKESDYIGIKSIEKLVKNGLDISSVDAIICATNTAKPLFPSLASRIATSVGARENITTFDLQAGCSGFLVALEAGSQYIQSGNYKKVLVLGIDHMTSIVSYTDRNSCVLFGDGGGCVVLEPTSSTAYGIKGAVVYQNASGHENLCLTSQRKTPSSLEELTQNNPTYEKPVLYQNGKHVFKLAITVFKKIIIDLLAKEQIRLEEVDKFILHQANKRILNAIGNELRIPEEKISANITHYGNTSCGTIPICLAEEMSGFSSGSKIVLAAFGAGFIAHATYLVWK